MPGVVGALFDGSFVSALCGGLCVLLCTCTESANKMCFCHELWPKQV